MELNSMVSTSEGKYMERRFLLCVFIIIVATFYMFLHKTGLAAWGYIVLPAAGMYKVSGGYDRHLVTRGNSE